MRSSFAAAVAVLLAACGGDPPSRPETASLPSDGFSRTPLDCAAPTMPSLETGTCVSVGPATVPTSFVRAPDGYRFTGPRPEDVCGKGERAQHGAATCVPIDEGCARAFPPADATLVVSATMPPGGNVVATLAEALTRAKSGDVIALDEGEHATFERAVPVRLVGRCAEKVVLRPEGERTTGIWFTGAGSYGVESVTIRGSKTALRAATAGVDVLVRHVRLEENLNGFQADGGTITVRESVVDGNWSATGAGMSVVATGGGSLTFEDGTVEDSSTSVMAAGSGSRVVVRRSLLRGPAKATSAIVSSVLAGTTDGGDVLVEDSVLMTPQVLISADGGGGPGGAPSHLKVVRSDLSQTNKKSLTAGSISQGSRVELEDTSFLHNSEFGLTMERAELSLLRSVMAATDAAAPSRQQIGALGQSKVTITESAIVGGIQNAITASGLGTTLTFERSLLTGLAFQKTHGRGLQVEEHASLTMIGSTAFGVEGTSVYIARDGVATLKSTVIDRALAVSEKRASTGAGIVVNEGSAMIDGVLVRRGDGPGIAFNAGRAIVKSSRMVENACGLLLASRASLLDVSDEPTEFVDGQLVVYDSELAGNTFDVLEAGEPIVTP